MVRRDRLLDDAHFSCVTHLPYDLPRLLCNLPTQNLVPALRNPDQIALDVPYGVPAQSIFAHPPRPPQEIIGG